MKNFITTFLLILFLSTLCFPKTYLSKSILIDGYFDTYYSNISWEDEKALLDNFAGRLIHDADVIGYIAFYSGKKDKPKKIQSRINRVKQYLIGYRKIDKNHIVIINAGKSEEAKTILQPKLKSLPPPIFYDDNGKEVK